MPRYRINIPVEIHTDGPLPEKFGFALGDHFEDYEDGRYPFNIEMVHRGLDEAIGYALKRACRFAPYDKYRRDTLSKDPAVSEPAFAARDREVEEALSAVGYIHTTIRVPMTKEGRDEFEIECLTGTE